MSFHEFRVDRLREGLRKLEVDFFIVRDKVNLYYLLGRKVEGFLLIPSDDKKLHLISDARYKFELEEMEGRNLKVHIFRNSAVEVIKGILKGKKYLGIEGNLPFRFYTLLKEKLNPKGIKHSNLVQELRMIKDEREIELIREATRIARSAYEKVRDEFLGRTEKQIRDLLEFEMRKLGADGASFPIIVAKGMRSAYPHAEVTDQIVKREDGFLLVDLGAKYKGYCSDLTLLCFLDKIPGVIRRAYKLIKEAQDLAISSIRAGIKVKGLVIKVEKYIKDKGFGEHLLHGLGHGIGLEVHEPPSLNRSSNEVLEAGMIVTIEPGLYFYGKGGVRLEKVVLVKERGAEVL